MVFIVINVQEVKMYRKLKGCGKRFSKKHDTKCGEWFQGDQHFCEKCFKKYHPELSKEI